jgi:hypothetical protein
MALHEFSLREQPVTRFFPDQSLRHNRLGMPRATRLQRSGRAIRAASEPHEPQESTCFVMFFVTFHFQMQNLSGFNELPRSKLRGIPAGKKNASQQAAGYLPGKE